MKRFFKKFNLSPGLVILLAVLIFAAAGNVLFLKKGIGGQEERAAFFEARIKELRGGTTAPGTLERAAAGVDGFKKRLPDRKGLTTAISEVLDAAGKNGLKIEAGDYSPETVKDTGISRYTFSFPVEGRYPQVKRFIHELESLKTPLVIEDVSLVSGKGQGAIAVKVRVSIYYL